MVIVFEATKKDVLRFWKKMLSVIIILIIFIFVYIWLCKLIHKSKDEKKNRTIYIL